MRSPWSKEAQGIGCPGAGQHESQARSAAAIKARLSSTTRVQVFSISAFPQGSLWRERPPEGRGDGVTIRVHQRPLPGGAPASKKGGSLPPPSPVSCGAPTRRARRGRAGRRPAALYRGGLGESVPTLVQRRFSGTAHATVGRAAPSESAALWLSNACTTYVHNTTL